MIASRNKSRMRAHGSGRGAPNGRDAICLKPLRTRCSRKKNVVRRVTTLSKCRCVAYTYVAKIWRSKNFCSQCKRRKKKIYFSDNGNASQSKTEMASDVCKQQYGRVRYRDAVGGRIWQT